MAEDAMEGGEPVGFVCVVVCIKCGRCRMQVGREMMLCMCMCMYWYE